MDKLKIIRFIMMISIIMTYVFIYFYESYQSILFIFLASISIIVSLVMYLFYWRCPYCNKHIFHVFFIKRCQYCGNRLFDNEY